VEAKSMSAPNQLPTVARLLTRDEIREELARIKSSAADPLGQAVAGHAKLAGEDPRDLLNEAILRALATRAVPSNIPFEAVLSGIARSVASGITKRRVRARERVPDTPLEDLIAAIPAGGYTVSTPDEIIERERVRQICADAIKRLARDDATREALIDAIGQGIRGNELAATLGISKRDLASMRKALKREIQRIWPTVDEQIGKD